MRLATLLRPLHSFLKLNQPKRNCHRLASRSLATRRLVLESLEVRQVFSATFGAALSFGNDSSGATIAYDVATDTAGNSYMTGYFNGTVDFDESALHSGDTDILTALGNGDAFVAKYAPDNSLVWARRMGGVTNATTIGTPNDTGRTLVVDRSGNVFVAGQFLNSADFGSTILSSTGTGVDGFVTKLDASGTFQWAKRFGTSMDDSVDGVGIDSSGNVYTLNNNSSGYDILKFNSTGSAVWTKSIATTVIGRLSTNGLAVSPSGNVFVAGSFYNTVDFDPSSKTYNVTNPGGTIVGGFVLKLDTNGKFGWVSNFAGQTGGASFGRSNAQSVALDGSGNVVVGGIYSESVDFQPGSGITTLPAVGGVFITKLNSSGGLVWARALEKGIGNSNPYVPGLAVDSAGSIYAAGSFSGTIDLDPGTGTDVRTSAGGLDIFVVKLTAVGNYSWGESFGGTGSDAAFGIAVDSTGDVHLAGYYQNMVDFDPTNGTFYLTTNGVSKAFRLRLRQV